MIASHITASSSSPKRTTISFIGRRCGRHRGRAAPSTDPTAGRAARGPRLPVRAHRRPRAHGCAPGTRSRACGRGTDGRQGAEQGEDPLVELDHVLFAETAVEEEIDELRYPAAVDPVDDLRLVGKEVGKLRSALPIAGGDGTTDLVVRWRSAGRRARPRAPAGRGRRRTRVRCHPAVRRRPGARSGRAAPRRARSRPS